MNQNLDLKVRRANPEDAGLLAELGARTFSETFAADNSPQDIAAYIAASFNLAQQTAELADPASTFFIAEVGGPRQVTQSFMQASQRRASRALSPSNWCGCMCRSNGSAAVSVRR